MSTILRLATALATTPPTVAVEVDEVYKNPGTFAQVRFYLMAEKMLPDPAWERPLVADPDFVAPEDDPNAEAPMIPDESAEHPLTLQTIRHPLLGKAPEQSRIDGDELASFHATLASTSVTSLALDAEGVDPYDRALFNFMGITDPSKLAQIIGLEG